MDSLTQGARGRLLKYLIRKDPFLHLFIRAADKSWHYGGVSHSVKASWFLPSFFLITLAFLFAGCLVYETVDYRLTLNNDGKSGSISIECTNIESSAADSAHQNEDFAELISKWKGDKYLLERMDDGVYIKERSLVLRKGVLVGRETGIFSDLRRLKDEIRYDDTTRITIAKDRTVLSTNGTLIIYRDRTVVYWPPQTRDFRIKIQQRSFEPTSHFAEKFRSLRRK
jgi:hypothetical protein